MYRTICFNFAAQRVLMGSGRKIIYWVILLFSTSALAQDTVYVDVGQSKKEYIRENHVEDIEDLIHKFTSSKRFLNFLLKEGHDIDPDGMEIKRKDIIIGEDLDIYVKHFTEHQNFTMIMVPINIGSLAIFDTLLFTVIEVSQQWMKDRFYKNDLEDDSVKSHLLSIENHSLLSRHMYGQALKGNNRNLNWYCNRY